MTERSVIDVADGMSLDEFRKVLEAAVAQIPKTALVSARVCLESCADEGLTPMMWIEWQHD